MSVCLSVYTVEPPINIGHSEQQMPLNEGRFPGFQGHFKWDLQM